MGNTTARDIMTFIVCILICQAAGFIGSLFTSPAIPNWYANLAKPFFTPPNYVFAPVWTTLFLMMGVSLFLIWRKSGVVDTIRPALILFGVQLLLNVLWSVMFFGLRSPFAAFIEILFLWSAILATIMLFFSLSKAAGILLVQYILWVSFATVLNFMIWRLNL